MQVIYQALSEDQETFHCLSGLQVADFDALYDDFAAAWSRLKMERRRYTGQAQPSRAGRKFAVSLRDQLLSVLLWFNLGLHPQDLSKLLGVHLSTFARIRQRVLAVLYDLNMPVEPPEPHQYQRIGYLSHVWHLPAFADTSEMNAKTR